MKVMPYLFFNGQAREAALTYARILKLPEPEIMTLRDGPPMGVPEDRLDWVMHCALPLGEGTLMLSDDTGGDTPAMAGSNVMLSLPTEAEGRRVFDALAEGGEVRVPWAPIFWAAGFGALTDRFGIRWMVDCDEAPAD